MPWSTTSTRGAVSGLARPSANSRSCRSRELGRHPLPQLGGVLLALAGVAGGGVRRDRGDVDGALRRAKED